MANTVAMRYRTNKHLISCTMCSQCAPMDGHATITRLGTKASPNPAAIGIFLHVPHKSLFWCMACCQPIAGAGVRTVSADACRSALEDSMAVSAGDRQSRDFNNGRPGIVRTTTAAVFSCAFRRLEERAAIITRTWYGFVSHLRRFLSRWLGPQMCASTPAARSILPQ